MIKQQVEGFRLSQQQEQLWEVEQQQRGAINRFRSSCRVRIKGVLEGRWLRRAAEAVVRRHEILRTTYEYLPAMTLPVQVVNEGEAASSFISWQEQEQEVDFDYERGPLLQLCLVKLNREEHELWLSLPALCADARSLRNLVAELRRCYEAITQGTQLHDEPLQYADFAEIQHELLESDDTEAGRTYWNKVREKLGAATRLTHLESIAGPSAEFEPRSLLLAYEAGSEHGLARVARAQQCTMAELLLSCWVVLLRRVTGQSAVVLGVQCEGRKHERLQGALGLFARQLPLQLECSGEERFGELLQQVREQREELEKWQEYYRRDEGEGRYWPVCFAYEESSEESESGWEVQTAVSWAERFGVQLRSWGNGEQVSSALDYDGAVYERGAVAWLGQEFERLVGSVVSEADARVSELEIVSAAEQQLLREWNTTAVRYEGEDLCLHELVEAQVERTPEAIAVVYEQEQLSYRELNERANQLAHYLRRAGVGTESLVGILMERSVELVVTLLAVLKAGAAYVPLDPGYPGERLSFMIADAGVELLLTQGELAERVRVGAEVQVLNVERQWGEVAEQAKQNPESGVRGENLAYVIYTSGSSGRPKGVMIAHRSIVNRLLWMQHNLPLQARDRVLQKTPFSFDASVWELFVPLLSGAQLWLARPGGERDTSYLVQAIREGEISIVQMVPSLLRVWLQEREVEQCRSLRRVYCGGEELTAELRERFFASGLGAELHNLYGPTEVSIDATQRECERSEGGHGRVPIGRAIGKLQVYVLDEWGHETGIGVQGELYIGGAGLARGYQGRGALTAERFVPDGVSGKSGARLYRTGDQGRYRWDGELEYLGRADGQVKVRGNRIELAEIEAALTKHPKVQHCIVLVKEDLHGDKRLNAYVVAVQGAEGPTISDLREHLGTCVPPYMIPSVFVMLNVMPLLPNGKIDRNALLAIEPASSVLEKNLVAARNPIEEILGTIWAQLLGMNEVSRDDNFFELGGHSLLAMQVISRIREALQVELPLRSLFEAPTVGELALQVEAGMRTKEEVERPPISVVSRAGKLPLSFAQQRLWFLDQLEPGSSFYNLPEGIRLRGSLDVAALEDALGAVIKRHEALRTTFSVSEGEPVQVVHEATEYRLPVIDLGQLEESEREAEVARVARAEASTPFDLAVGPLLRAQVIRLDEAEHVVLLTMHHIISDGWSMGVLVKEIAALYEAIASGTEVDHAAAALERLPIQYADYAVWQREWLSGAVLERQLSYWKEQLRGAAPVLELPTDKPRPPVQTFNGFTSFLNVDKSLSESLERLGRDNEVTMFILFLTVFQVLLHYQTKQEDIVIGTDATNRSQIDTEGLIGFFINQLVLRGRLSSEATFTELLAQAREISLSAYTHQDFPFDKLVEALKPKRDLRYPPLFQVKFFYQNAPATVPAFSDLIIENIDFNRGIARLDLTLALWPTPYGFRGWFNYNTDLFTEATIKRMSEQFKTILEGIVEQPDVTLDELEERLDASQKAQQSMEKQKLIESKFSKFKKIKPKPVNVSPETLVKTSVIELGGLLPLVVEPLLAQVDLVNWTRNSRAFIEEKLLHHGAILFRGFDINTPLEFEQCALSICPQLFNENGEHPRQTISANVYTPVFYPPDKQLLWHNENSFNYQWPGKIWFGCAKPADQGGETPIVDSRKVFQAIAPEIRERFIERKIMYSRNYGEGLGLSWQTVFQTSDKAEVESYCRRVEMEFEWKPNDRLRTRCVRPAVINHPKTKEPVWFNQAQHWHLSCLDEMTRASLLSVFPEEDLPRNCYYGDGAVIEDSVMAEICGVYKALEVCFPWHKGDVLLLDNMLTAHGRNAFAGERKLFVAMGEMISKDDI